MKVSKRPEIIPGEWQTDETGRRFRMIGNCIEYEREINGIPESIFFAAKKAQQEREAAEFERSKREAAEMAVLRRNCPFNNNGMHTDCTREKCALFASNGCTLAQIVGRPAADTVGKQCPFNVFRKACRQDCALYKNGCTLTSVILVKNGE